MSSLKRIDKHKMQTLICEISYYERFFMPIIYPTGGPAVLRSKPVEGRCRVYFPVALVVQAFRCFPWFSPKLA